MMKLKNGPMFVVPPGYDYVIQIENRHLLSIYVAYSIGIAATLLKEIKNRQSWIHAGQACDVLSVSMVLKRPRLKREAW